MVDDILARWGGLRSLIDIRFTFDGNWPINSIIGNAVSEIFSQLCCSDQGVPAACLPSPQWIERFYKALVGVWFYQETVNLTNVMYWECTSALSVFRELSTFFNPGSTILDSADLVKTWNILFYRLLAPPFQLGNPDVLYGEVRPTLDGLRHALRPPDISDLLIASTEISIRFPQDSHQYLFPRGAFDLQNYDGICLTWSRDDHAPHEDGKFFLNEIGLAHAGMILQLTVLFHAVGVGHVRVAKRYQELYFWFRILGDYSQSWRTDLLRPTDTFGAYRTSDQVVEAIIGKEILKEMLRRGLDQTVPFAQV
jgi:hypothetical protein